MQGHAKVWLISAALGFSACARGALDDADGNAVRQNPKSPDYNPYDVTQPGSHAGSGGQSGKGGAGSSPGGSAGRASTASGTGGFASTAGAGGAGAGSAGASAGLAGGGSNAAAGTAGANATATQDCPSLTRVRLASSVCVDRITEFSVANTPTSIVTGSDGQVWFDDDGIDQLVQLDSEGRVLARINCGAGSSPRALLGGRDDALVWYTDAGAKTLNRLTQTSQLVFNLDFTAAALALGDGDQIWLTDAGQAVYQISPGALTTPYPFAPSKAIAVGPDKNVWFPEGAQIARLTPGAGKQDFPTVGSADELCPGPDGALWFTDGTLHQIGRMAVDGTLTNTYALPTGSGPSRIIVGPDGALWFTEQGGDKIGRITVQGEITQYPIPTRGGVPFALTLGADHNLWFTEKFSGKIGRLIPDPLG